MNEPIITTHWTLEEALDLIRLIQPETRRFGYHLCLAGGVLNKGWSNKDLDLAFLPMDKPDKLADPEGMLQFLTSLWGTGLDIRTNTEASVEETYPEVSEDSPYVEKRKFDYSGMRIDVFIMKDSRKTLRPQPEKKALSDLERFANACWGSPNDVYLGQPRQPRPAQPQAVNLNFIRRMFDV